MFFGALKKQNSKTPMLIFDIGSTSVGAAIVLCGGDEPPFVVHAERHWLPPMQEVSMERLAGLLETAIDAVSKDMLSVGAKRLAAAGYSARLPHIIHCFLTAPWYAPHTDTVRLSSEKPFTVTRDMFSRAVARERAALEETLARASGLTVVEHQVISLSANGYETENPFGKDASELLFLTYTALAEEQVLSRFRSRIRRAFHADEIAMHSFLLAFFSSVRDIPDGEHDFLLVDVSGEVTEVSVVKGGRLSESVSFPLGRNFLARALAAGCGISCREALSLLAVHFSGRGNEDFTKRFLPAVSRVEKEWMGGFEECLSHVAGEAFLPHTTFVAADREIAPWITAAIQDEALYQHTLTAKPFLVNLADEKIFDSYVTFGPGVAKDPFLMVDALFVDKMI